jgi:hydrogenase maturation protein HypF
VRIRVTGNQTDTDNFLLSLKNEAPPASMIENITLCELENEEFSDFIILHSHDISDEITEISPDIAVCKECLEDMGMQGSRLDYAFVNCTNCGPRFTIIRDLPYDRDKTTMQPFEMCADCRNEYESIYDRRFHAQPTACERCGPHYELFVDGNLVTNEMKMIVDTVSECIESGGVILIKGLGGMHLACNAFDETAVEKLRKIKNRDGKPFAVMFRDLESIKKYAVVDETEARSLTSWRSPIVLLEMKTSINPPFLAHGINAGLTLAGAMLPYMPFHYLLFQHLKTSAIVLTSGNVSSDPILISNQAAIDQFATVADAVLLHNRDIFNRTDDSVVRIMGGVERIFRRSRGYAPAPVRTTMNADGIVAFGAELTNCFCIGKGHKAFLSQHIGDLQGLETTRFYEQTIAQFLKLFRVEPSLLAVDMHPLYISTKTAQNFNGIPVVAIQHHHAHIASCMMENHLDEKVIGVALDGTGYGEDGHSWGGEFFLCDLHDYSRITHFAYIPQPGGDLASEEPWRMAVSYLYHVYGIDFLNLKLPFFAQVDPDKIQMVVKMIDRQINCPMTSGAGRLFDAVASIVGLCHTASFQAEGPMLLESVVIADCSEDYPFEIDDTIRFDKTIRGIVDDILHGVSFPVIATKFHNTLISVIFDASNSIRKKEGINKVALSGGVFQNQYLLEGVMTLLRKNNFEVYTHASIPCNDGGIALGQLAVASKRRENKCV